MNSPIAAWPETGQETGMKTPAFLSIADQAAGHLRAEILRGRWSGVIPGKHQLAAELGLNNKTVETALRQLEQTGILLPQGAGRRRLINPEGAKIPRALRVVLFLNEAVEDRKSEIYIELHHALSDAGHTVVHAEKSLTEIGFEVNRTARIAKQTGADAWIIFAGSRAVLEWFAAQPVPSFALFGHRIGIRIPAVSPDKPPVIAGATRHLMQLGHSRIVLLCRKIRRLPVPGLSEAVFLDTLRAGHCSVSGYNLPDWQETNEGFQACLAALFKVTPPTALIVDEAPYFIAAMQFLLSRGIRVPHEVSLICTDDDPSFAHCAPPVACITWDRRPVVRRVLNWVSSVSRGTPDFRQTLTPAQFAPGGTIGPPKA